MHRPAFEADKLLRLQEVLESISSGLELRPLLTRIVRAACELLEADDGTIGLYDPLRGVIRTEAAHNMPPDEVGAEMPPGVGLAGRVLASGEPLVLGRYGDIGQPTQPSLLENTVVGVPIVWRGQLTGVFGIGARPPRRFEADDVDVLQLLARHAALAIENARLYAREQQRNERLALIARIGQLVTANFDLEELLQRAADAIHEQLGYPNVDIPLVDAADPHTLVIRVRGGHHKRSITWEDRLPVGRGIMGAAVSERRVQLVNDVLQDPRYIKPPGPMESRAELAVPILLGEQVLGVLNVESPTPFDQDDATSLQIVADALAVGIRNARLFESAQRLVVLEERQRLSRDLHDSVAQHLFSVTLLAQSLRQAFARDPAEGERVVTRLLELTRSALAEMRALVAELRPGEPAPGLARAEQAHTGIAGLREQGLAGALRRHADEIATGTLQVELDLPPGRPLPAAYEEVLYRIAQEGINNAVKHSHARHLWVRLELEPEAVCLHVRDDGHGFEPQAPGERPGRGLGLLGMRERAEALGGEVYLESSPGAGTLLRVRLPWTGRS